MKQSDKAHIALLMTFGERLHFETQRLEESLARYKSLKRRVYYQYIGDAPTTQSASPRTNPELFMPQEGHQYLLDGLVQLRNEIFTTVEMLDDQPENVQHTP